MYRKCSLIHHPWCLRFKHHRTITAADALLEPTTTTWKLISCAGYRDAFVDLKLGMGSANAEGKR
ncbi:hypothetical protein PGTUg99_018105 [Puccinia graminis f. sp. tritici]|uniref:Uncharacterized protein n=1 Tax=Puccinia graminis f. sp. tritici TaxID=56615 RepID=A0A5B0PVS0_PUCGR|nr:hypothetical protein PGTUg99_018105 [Puccinia graminis f. sp. tritici]